MFEIVHLVLDIGREPIGLLHIIEPCADDKRILIGLSAFEVKVTVKSLANSNKMSKRLEVGYPSSRQKARWLYIFRILSPGGIALEGLSQPKSPPLNLVTNNNGYGSSYSVA